MSNVILVIISALLMLPGFVGIVFPILPGIPYMLIIALVYGAVTGFNTLNGTELTYLGALTGISLIVDYTSGILGAKLGGASLKSLGYGAIGMIVGGLVLPPLGGIVGLFIGIVIGESKHFDPKRAIKAGIGGTLGAFTGMLINVFIALTFLILYLVFSLRG